VDAARDTGSRDAAADAKRDAGPDGSRDAAVDASVDSGFDAGPPPDFTEPMGVDTDPFMGGAAAATGADLSPGSSVSFGGSIDGAGTDAWADSDGYAFHVSTETKVQARLSFAPSARIYSVAIHRADRHVIAYWGMSRSGRALTTPVTLPVGEYFVHVAASPPATSSAEPYRVELIAGDLPTCASAATTDYTELEAVGATRSNDVFAVDLDAFPILRETDGADAFEPSALNITTTPVAIEGVSNDMPTDDDSYLDRDMYRVHVDADMSELGILLEHVSADVNMDIMVFDAADGALVGTGIAISDSPEHARVGVLPDHDYDVWIAARDERRIGGDTALPLSYRVSLCGFGGAP